MWTRRRSFARYDLQVGDVYILKQPLALPISIATAAIIYIVPAIVDKPERLIPILDILSVGIYSATAQTRRLSTASILLFAS